MKEINETNYCILTGMLINKGRNADTKDMKRPVLDIEIVNTDSNGEISFVEIPVLLSDVVLSKAVPGYCIGEILIKQHPKVKQEFLQKKFLHYCQY